MFGREKCQRTCGLHFHVLGAIVIRPYNAGVSYRIGIWLTLARSSFALCGGTSLRGVCRCCVHWYAAAPKNPNTAYSTQQWREMVAWPGTGELRALVRGGRRGRQGSSFLAKWKSCCFPSRSHWELVGEPMQVTVNCLPFPEGRQLSTCISQGLTNKVNFNSF